MSSSRRHARLYDRTAQSIRQSPMALHKIITPNSYFVGVAETSYRFFRLTFKAFFCITRSLLAIFVFIVLFDLAFPDAGLADFATSMLLDIITSLGRFSNPILAACSLWLYKATFLLFGSRRVFEASQSDSVKNLTTLALYMPSEMYTYQRLMEQEMAFRTAWPDTLLSAKYQSQMHSLVDLWSLTHVNISEVDRRFTTVLLPRSDAFRADGIFTSSTARVYHEWLASERRIMSDMLYGLEHGVLQMSSEQAIDDIEMAWYHDLQALKSYEQKPLIWQLFKSFSGNSIDDLNAQRVAAGNFLNKLEVAIPKSKERLAQRKKLLHDYSYQWITLTESAIEALKDATNGKMSSAEIRKVFGDGWCVIRQMHLKMYSVAIPSTSGEFDG